MHWSKISVFTLLPIDEGHAKEGLPPPLHVERVYYGRMIAPSLVR